MGDLIVSAHENHFASRSSASTVITDPNADDAYGYEEEKQLHVSDMNDKESDNNRDEEKDILVVPLPPSPFDEKGFDIPPPSWFVSAFAKTTTTLEKDAANGKREKSVKESVGHGISFHRNANTSRDDFTKMSSANVAFSDVDNSIRSVSTIENSVKIDHDDKEHEEENGDPDEIDCNDEEYDKLPLKHFLPLAARELSRTALSKMAHYGRMSVILASCGGGYSHHCDLGIAGGYVRETRSGTSTVSGGSGEKGGGGIIFSGQGKKEVVDEDELPPFSSLPWIERQLVSEWRTIHEEDARCLTEAQDALMKRVASRNFHARKGKARTRRRRGGTNRKTSEATSSSQKKKRGESCLEHRCRGKDECFENSSGNETLTKKASDEESCFALSSSEDDMSDCDADFEKARCVMPLAKPRPSWDHASNCHLCFRLFSPTLLRHHCRSCGRSCCQTHSSSTHRLPHFGYHPLIPERVCDICKQRMEYHDLVERIAWRMARIRDYFRGDLTPYFTPGVDTVHDAAMRITNWTIHITRKMPLGAQATVAVETVEVLRKHGLKGVYGFLLRKEFLQAAELLREVTGIDAKTWPLSVHELSAAIFYALAEHRRMRGCDPEREHRVHRLKTKQEEEEKSDDEAVETVSDEDTDATFAVMIEAKKTLPDGTQDYAAPSSRAGSPSSPSSGGFIDSAAVVVEEGDGDNEDNRSHLPLAVLVADDDDGDLATVNVEGNSDDTYDPTRAENVADLLAMADVAISEGRIESDGGRSRTGAGAGKAAMSRAGVDGAESGKINPPAKVGIVEPVCTPVSDSVLQSLLFYAPLANSFIYAGNEIEMQLLAAQQGWTLVYAHANQIDVNSGHAHLDRPATALFVHRQQKVACFAIRGTASLNDVVTDIRATPVPFPLFEEDSYCGLGGHVDDVSPHFSPQRKSKKKCKEGMQEWTSLPSASTMGGDGGLALSGMARAAVTLFRENLVVFLQLVRDGYRIRITGHSLGGGVAALLGILVRKHLDGMKDLRCGEDILRVYGYGTPACVDRKLANISASFVTTVVLHDDVFPRLTPTSVRKLLKHLLHIRETWVKRHLVQDVRAVADRAKSGWAPRWRQSFVLKGGKGSGREGVATKKETTGNERVLGRKAKFLGKDGLRAVAEEDNDDENHDHQTMTSSCEGCPFDENENEEEDVFEGEEPLVESSDEEGDCYTNQSIVDNNDKLVTIDSTCYGFSSWEATIDANYGVTIRRVDEDVQFGKGDSDEIGRMGRREEEEDDWVPFDEPPLSSPINDDVTSEKKSANMTADEHFEETERNNGSPVMLEEAPLSRLFVPGSIVHIYTHRGAYKASFVPRTFRELRRISLAGNMLTDHISSSYYTALLEVQSVRNAAEGLPTWIGFDEGATCSCCASSFTWASTSDSEAQEARDKHNCRCCGHLVCDPCSTNRVPLPKLGITLPSRICNRCYYDLAGLGTGDEHNYAMTRSYIDDETEEE